MSHANQRWATVTLFSRPVFEEFILALPAVELVHQWGNMSVGKIGGKIFALQTHLPSIAFKCSDTSFALLPELEGVAPAKYLARAHWVDVFADTELGQADLAAYITEAHRLVASKLPQKIKTSLALDGL